MSSAFETAVADSKKLTAKPNTDELLEIYGECPRNQEPLILEKSALESCKRFPPSTAAPI